MTKSKLKKRFGKGVLLVLEFQHKFFRFDISKTDFDNPQWYNEHEISEYDYDRWGRALARFIYKNRKKLTDVFTMMMFCTPKNAENYVAWWNLCYGWKVNYDKKNRK
jgi:hypothetical protein